MKGHRFYDWAVIDLAGHGSGHHQLLIRRNRATGELAYYRCFSPQPVPLTKLVRVTGSRWRVKETFQAEKGLVDSMSTRFAATPPGPDGSPRPCSPTPSSPSSVRRTRQTVPPPCLECQRFGQSARMNDAPTTVKKEGRGDLLLRIGGRFARVEPRRRMRDYVRGLLGPGAVRMAGSSPHTPVTPPPTGCSVCSPGTAGMLMRSAITARLRRRVSWRGRRRVDHRQHRLREEGHHVRR